jgi:hypothetical protein
MLVAATSPTDWIAAVSGCVAAIVGVAQIAASAPYKKTL